MTSISSVKEKKEAGDGEVVRRERYAARPALEEIFKGSGRDEAIAEAIHRWGYKLKEVGDFAGLHYSRVSRITSRMSKNKT